MIIKKRGQVWIETVLYTLIALALIGGVLAFITPKITDARDTAVVEQAISTLNYLDDKVNSALVAPGSRRVFDLTLRKGEMTIDSATDTVLIKIDGLRSPYSQPGAEIKNGRVKILTTQGQKTSSVLLSINYKGYADIQYTDMQAQKTFSPASTAYGFSLENKGVQAGSEQAAPLLVVDEISGK